MCVRVFILWLKGAWYVSTHLRYIRRGRCFGGVVAMKEAGLVLIFVYNGVVQPEPQCSEQDGGRSVCVHFSFTNMSSCIHF